MLNNLAQQPADSLLALIKLHNDDPRASKIDLGVGVYRTGQGDTPVFGAIKAAEKKLLQTQTSKAYLGPEGDMGFVHALMPWIFGKADPDMGGRIEGMQTPGGTGAVRLAMGLAKRAGVKRIWMGTPSWPNHAQIIADLGLELKAFNHNTADGVVDMAELLAVIAGADDDDAILLHGCCHNPTGIDYANDQWDVISPAIRESRLQRRFRDGAVIGGADGRKRGREQLLSHLVGRREATVEIKDDGFGHGAGRISDCPNGATSISPAVARLASPARIELPWEHESGSSSTPTGLWQVFARLVTQPRLGWESFSRQTQGSLTIPATLG